MAKKILIILGHPQKESFNGALAKSYKDGAVESGAEVREICIGDLVFDPNFSVDKKNHLDLEPDLKKAQQDIAWADHMVIIHPLWWGGVPALLKGFIDRVFLPGFAYKYRENSVWWDKLLKGKTGHIIFTMDQPYFYYWLINGRPGIHSLKKMTLEFCGVKPVKVTPIGPVRKSLESYRQKKLRKVQNYGRKEGKH